MNSALYKDCKTSRGYNYHYYFSPPRHERPFLVFIHGFPSTSKDWRKQVPFFEDKGFGVIAPDMLGYGGTSKPLDAGAYKHSLVAKDIIDILDSEEVQQAVFIGHDWGSRITSRMPQLFPDRTIAVAFLAVGYTAPAPDFNYEAALALAKEKVGYELIGYWAFFSEDDAWKLCENKIDAFFSLLFPEDPKLWVTDVAPRGALRRALSEDKPFPPASWMSAEDRKLAIEALLEGGLKAACGWYKVWTSGFQTEDDDTIPVERYEIEKPVFFGAALEDYIALAPLGKANIAKYCKNATVRDFKANHWLALQVPDDVNRELLRWVEGL